jgi:putative membrane protein insertion efficiency factor
MKRFLLAIIRIYQLTISALIGPRCRFYPSCSAYSHQAIDTHGALRGIGMSAVRISKCHPFHPGGYDPVPHGPIRNAVEEAL